MSEHTHEYDEDGGSCRICGMTVSDSLRSLAPAPSYAVDLDAICARLNSIEEHIARDAYDSVTWSQVHIARLHLLGAAQRVRHNAQAEPPARRVASAGCAPATLLAEAAQALDDWITTYAPVYCDESHVDAAKSRIACAGGTIAYAADLRDRLLANTQAEARRDPSL